jgi:hypothetical protein
MITNNVDDLFFSVTDIYTQYDEGEINYAEAVVILNRVCRHFLGENNEQD